MIYKYYNNICVQTLTEVKDFSFDVGCLGSDLNIPHKEELRSALQGVGCDDNHSLPMGL